MKASAFDILHHISPSKHYYQFYKHADDYLRAMIAYFQAGLEAGDACLWLVSEKIGMEEACETAESVIPGFPSYVERRQLQILSAEDWYLHSGCFDEGQSFRNASYFLEEIQKLGFSRIRGAGDAGAVPRRDWPRLWSYEKNVDSLIKASPLIALCAYPILELSLKETKMVLDCHDDVLINHF